MTSVSQVPDDDVVFNHVGQCVSDLPRATRFYVEALGFEVERELAVPDEMASALLDVEPPVGLLAVYLRLGPFCLELFAFDRPANPSFKERVFNEPGLTHLSISVEDFDTAVARVETLGGTVLRGGPKAAMVRDPDGQLLELLPMSYRRRIDSAAQRETDRPRISIALGSEDRSCFLVGDDLVPVEPELQQQLFGVLAVLGSGLQGVLLLVEHDRVRHQRKRDAVVALDVDDVAIRADLGIVVDLECSLHRSPDALHAVERLPPLVQGPGCERFVEYGDALGPVS